ncbi:MAG: uridine kinase [Saprospiraceae bacterium]
MTSTKQSKKTNWLKQSQHLLRSACTPWGIKASLTNKTNYGAIFTRDAVMSGIAGVLLKDDIIIEGFKNTLLSLKQLQGKQGQIASNFKVKEGQVVEISFGTLSPKIDSCTWYLIGIGILIKEGKIAAEDFKESVEKTIDLLEGLEYNGKHLMYIPKGGNWADEYVYEGYILYDQVLRVWGLSLLASVYDNEDWQAKADSILEVINQSYLDKKSEYFHASFYPGGSFKKFDLAAHTIAGFIFNKNNAAFEQSLDWIMETFIKQDKLPTAFYPVIDENDTDWNILSKYHLFDFKNKPHHYHNGGIWWIWLGWLSVTLSLWNKKDALNQLIETAFKYLDNLEHFDFDEYVAADDLSLHGTKQLCYSATGIIFLSLAKKSFDFSDLKTPEISLIKEDIPLKKGYFKLSSELIEVLKDNALFDNDKLVIGVCGESGSGKSVTAKCLQIELEKLNIPTMILHQDNYYKLLPKENHLKRKENIDWVGVNELRLDLFQSHIEAFKSKKETLTLPTVDYKKNTFSQQTVSIKGKSVLIVEGVYSFFLEKMDFKVFMERTYKDTLESRKSRSREVYDPFVEQVLDIEHRLVAPLTELADVIISSDYSILVKSLVL